MLVHPRSSPEFIGSVGHTPDSSPHVRYLFLLWRFETERGRLVEWRSGLDGTLQYRIPDDRHDMVGLVSWVSDIATHMTVLWEMTFWMLVWRPAWRPIMLLIGVCMHLGIGVCLGMWTFGLIMMFTYISFIPPTRYAAWEIG